MRIPYSIQGTLFAWAMVFLVFILKVTCPVPSGSGCFADFFITPMFLPAVLVNRVFYGVQFLINNEPLVILLYWGIVGFLLGLCFDLYSESSEEEKGVN